MDQCIDPTEEAWDEFFAKVPTVKAPKQVGGSHYNKYSIEPVDFIYYNDIGYLEGNVIKYVVRHADKNGKEDLLKAIHYLEMLIDREYDDE